MDRISAGGLDQRGLEVTLDELLPRLQSVRPRGNGRYSALCDAHADRSPSLSICEGDKGLLLKCWAGCTVEEIFRSLGLEQRDLFYDADLPRSQRPAPRTPQINRRSLAFQFEIGALDLRLRAERIFTEGKNINLGILISDELDRALGCLAKAHMDIERAELFEGVADGLRYKEFYEKESYEPQRVA